MSRNNDSAIGNLLNFFVSSNYELHQIALRRQKKYKYSSTINFTGKSEEEDGATIFFIAEKQQKNIL